MKYRPEIDGLRAVAVLPVMIFHAGLTLFSGGFVGVDIFFVISGFLITSIIFREIESGHFSFINFYERRTRRILPALYFVLISCIPLAWFFLVPDDYYDFSNSLMGVVAFISNIVFWQQFDYFSASAEYIPLLHTWSLAIEEQYYLFFPLLLIALHRYGVKVVFYSLTAIFLGSLLLSQIGSAYKPSATYYLLPTRFWELLIGSLIALCVRYNTLNINNLNLEKKNILSMLGIMSIVLSLFVIDKSTPFPSFWALLPTLGTGLIILFANEGTHVNRLLSQKVFVGIGMISYSAYLWHQPIFAFLRHQYLIPVTQLNMILGLFLSLFLAFISWKYIEAPFRNKNKTSRKLIFVSSIIVSLIILFIGWLGVHYEGFKGRFKLNETLSEKSFDIPKLDNGWCFYSVDTDRSLSIGENGHHCKIGAETAVELNAILFGDSFAGMYEPFWDKVGKEHHLNINAVTTNWCYPSLTNNYYWANETPAREQCMSNRAYVRSKLSDTDVVILSAVWSDLPDSNFKEVSTLISTLLEHKNLKVIIMPQPAQFSRASVMRSVYLNGKLEYSSNEIKAKESNAILKELAANNDRVMFIDRESLFNLQHNASDGYDQNGLPYSFDGAHISIYGSNQAAENFINSANSNVLRDFLNSIGH